MCQPAFDRCSQFKADISKWDTAAVTTMEQSTSTPPLFYVGSCFFHLHSPLSRPLLFSHAFFPWHRHPPTVFNLAYQFNTDISKWDTAAVTTMYKSTSTPPLFSVAPCFFHLDSVHSHAHCFFHFFFVITLDCVQNHTRHRHPPAVFHAAHAFNADISKWNTAAVTDMAFSTSTPPLFLLLLAFT